MGIDISYMGTKRSQAMAVSEIVKSLPKGILLDMFSGMCSVAKAVSPNRQVWTNDIQVFPAIVGQSIFCSQSHPKSTKLIKKFLEPEFVTNLSALQERFCDYLVLEGKYLQSGTLKDVIAGNTYLPYVGCNNDLEEERYQLAQDPTEFPYRLATITYPGSYFGASQCMEIDSLRYSIDSAWNNSLITSDERDWLLIALGRVVSRVNNSTGQFAQYIKPKTNNLRRILEKRRRSVWNEFVESIETLSPAGTKSWRSRNRAFNSDALELLVELSRNRPKPRVIYADPPYSKAQYSRYYHVLDVLVEYRYPKITGDGRYPDHRYKTPFSHSSKVLTTMADFVSKVAKLNSILVLSYPTTGLYVKRGGNLFDLLNQEFRHVQIAHSEDQLHSTFGGPNVTPTISVTENLYLAYN